MTPDELNKIIVDRRRAIFRRIVSSVSDFNALAELSASRLRQYGEKALKIQPDAIELAKLQGKAEEAEFWLNLQNRINAEFDEEAKEEEARKAQNNDR